MEKYNIVKEDPRGVFAELLKADWGQLSYLEVNPVSIRGGHYHKRKSEIFILLEGECKLILRNGNGILEIDMERFKRYMVSPSTEHTVVNESDKIAKIIVFCDECYNPEDEDTYK